MNKSDITNLVTVLIMAYGYSNDNQVIYMVGFGYTDRPEGIAYNMDTWVQQIIDLMDALGIEKANLVGNSFGGGLAIGEKMDKYSIMTYVLNSEDFAITGGEFGIESSVISLFGYIIVAGIAFFMIKSRKNWYNRFENMKL